MASYFDGIIDFVGSHPHFALITVFLLASIPVVGTVVPGSTSILGISALTGPLWATVPLEFTQDESGSASFGINIIRAFRDLSSSLLKNPSPLRGLLIQFSIANRPNRARDQSRQTPRAKLF